MLFLYQKYNFLQKNHNQDVDLTYHFEETIKYYFFF